MKRRAFMQTLAAGGAGLSFSFTAGARMHAEGIAAAGVPPLQSFDFETISVDRRGATLFRKRLQARLFREDLGGGVHIDMVALERRPFLMGARSLERRRGPYDCARHCAEQPPLFMGRTPVTQDQWRAVARMPKLQRDLDPAPSCFVGGDRPVECVSWHDVQEFCARLQQHTGRAYRLPTEAEWEGACRAGTTTPFSFGDTVTAELANYGSLHAYDAEAPRAYARETTPVAQYLPNANGLHDMHGNVWEWCADLWRDSYRGSHDRLTALHGAEGARRSLRGGSWADEPAKLRSASRSGYAANSLNRIIGFRLGLSVDAA